MFTLDFNAAYRKSAAGLNAGDAIAQPTESDSFSRLLARLDGAGELLWQAVDRARDGAP